jgi:hypothetical protein
MRWCGADIGSFDNEAPAEVWEVTDCERPKFLDGLSKIDQRGIAGADCFKI